MALTSITCLALADAQLSRRHGALPPRRSFVLVQFSVRPHGRARAQRRLQRGARLRSRGMVALSVGLGAFWLDILPTLFPAHRLAVTSSASRAGSGLGILRHPCRRALARGRHFCGRGARRARGERRASSRPFATSRTSRSCCRRRLDRATTIDSLACTRSARTMYDRTRPPALPVIQRLTLLFVLAWGATTALRASCAGPPARPGRSAASSLYFVERAPAPVVVERPCSPGRPSSASRRRRASSSCAGAATAPF